MRFFSATLLTILTPLLFASCAKQQQTNEVHTPHTVRVAMFNIKELSTEKIMNVDENGHGIDPQAFAAAEIIKRINPDVLVLNEIDYDYSSYDGTNESLELNMKRFVKNYLSNGDGEVDYNSFFAAPNNTGLLSGFDFDNDGSIATDADVNTRIHGNDSWGYGSYPGQYSMGIMSRYPIAKNDVRTFQNYKWKDLSDSNIPTDWYDANEQNEFRLSSKSHWDVPVIIGEDSFHLFVCHPTPPVFDGPEDRNGRRNFDEIRFWSLYIDNSKSIYDDEGRSGGYTSKSPFIIAGDLNASNRSEPIHTGEIAINNLVNHAEINDPKKFLQSTGGLAGRETGAPNYWENATAGFMDGFRADYLLPSNNLIIIDGGVYWPTESEDPEGSKFAEEASDHRMVWLDINI